MSMSIATLLAIIGVSLGILEIAILGFGTVFLLFIALGCLLTSLLMFIGVLDQTLVAASLTVAVISSVSALALWKPLKRLQSNQQNPNEQPNVFAGLSFVLPGDLGSGESVVHRYSGVDWQVFKMETDDSVWPQGCEVEVVKTGVGKMWVKRL